LHRGNEFRGKKDGFAEKGAALDLGGCKPFRRGCGVFLAAGLAPAVQGKGLDETMCSGPRSLYLAAAGP
jgi:hypothetical protein